MTDSTYNKFLQLTETYENGNLSYAMRQVKKLSREDRARLVAFMRSHALNGTKTAFEVADRIIRNDF